MKNKITTTIIGLAIILGGFPASVFAQYDTSAYDYYSQTTSGYDYVSPVSSGYDYTSPTTSGYNYTSPTTSGYNYTSPTTSGYDYTSPSVSGYNYTSPTTSGYNYTSPTTYGYDYTSPTTSSYDYTSPTTSNYGYTIPAVSQYDYTSPTVSNYTYPAYDTGITYPTYDSYTPSYTYPNYDYSNYPTYSIDVTYPIYTTPVYPAPVYPVPNPVYPAPVYPTPVYPAPVYPTPTYPTYPTYPIYPTITYQTCWDGSRIPTTQSCPVKPVIKFNNVVTSITTQISDKSGRCNGIGLIANGVSSTGWFEYGETANLGRTTATANIGRNATAPFSNVLTNLKPSTKYYCRAVMQNQYGIVKGEIVSFVTKSKATSYVAPTYTAKKVTTKKTETTKKKEITCTDGTTVWSKDELVASTINEGGKLVSLRIEKAQSPVSANSLASYKVSYKNLSNNRLTGVVIKIVLPTEINLTIATAGNYDANTHTLTVNQDTLDPNAEGAVAVSGRVAGNAQIGKTIVATTNIIYTVPSTSVQDEVTAYVVSSIVPNDNISNQDTGAKKVIGMNDSNERGFMPSNLVEWLALIAIVFIIFILGRSIYISYKEDENTAGGHGH